MEPSYAEIINQDPVSWINPSRVTLPENCDRGIARGIINKILAQQFSLENDNFLPDESSLAKILAENWFILREAAEYAACQRYRAQILQSGQQSMLPVGARSFMLLNIIPAIADSGNKIDCQDISLLAWQELLPVLSDLSPEYVKRIKLIFPAAATKKSAPRGTDFDYVLFMMAIQHARKVSASL